MIPILLGSQHEGLPVIIRLDQLAVVLGDDLGAHGVLILRNLGNLDQHARDVVDGLQHLQVDRHVVGDLTAALLDFLLLRTLQIFAHTLCQKFSKLVVLVDFDEDLVRLVNESQPEGGHACLRDRPIEHNLIVNVLEQDHGTEVRFEKQISRFLIPIVQRVVENLAEGRTYARSRLPMPSDQLNKRVNFSLRILNEVHRR